MTTRENILRALTGGPHEFMPISVVIDNFNYPSGIPGDFNMPGILDFSDYNECIRLNKYLGGDMIYRLTPSAVKTRCQNTSYRSERSGPGQLTDIWDTPHGQLKALREESHTAKTTYNAYFPIQSMDDYDALADIVMDYACELDSGNIKKAADIISAVGDNGVAFTSLPSSPIMDIMRTWAGVAGFIYHLADDPGRIEALLQLMEERCMEYAKLVVEHSPCKALVFWDDANSLYLSPDMFMKYSIPFMKRYAELAHAHDKILVCHTCGTIKAFSELFLETGVDAVDWVAPWPIGDIVPKELSRIWDGKLTMMLSMQPDILQNGTPEDCAAHAEKLLEGVDPLGRIIFMVTAPAGSPMENVKAAISRLRAI